MKRQAIAVLTLGSFIVFSYSCTSVREIRPETLISRKTRAKNILRLEKTSGESIVFSKSQAGGVVGDSVTGIGAQESSLISMEIDKAQVKTIDRQGERILSVTMQDDKTYHVQRALEKPETLEIWILKSARPLVFEPVVIPIGQVKKAYVQKLNILATALAIFIPVGLILIGVLGYGGGTIGLGFSSFALK